MKKSKLFLHQTFTFFSILNWEKIQVQKFAEKECKVKKSVDICKSMNEMLLRILTVLKKK